MSPTTDSCNNDNLDLEIAQHLPYGIVACDETGNILFANKMAVSQLQEEYLTGINMLRLMADFADFKTGWERLLAEAQTKFTMSFSIKTIQNHSTTAKENNHAGLFLQANRLQTCSSEQKDKILILIESLPDHESGSVGGQLYTNALKNLVKEKNEKLELIHKQLILSERKAAMVETAGAVAHELRQPLTTIINTIELLNKKNELQKNSSIEKRFEVIQKQCLRMADIIKQMESLMEYKTREYINGSLIIDLDKSSQKEQPYRSQRTIHTP